MCLWINTIRVHGKTHARVQVPLQGLQRASGGGFVPLFWVPIDKIELTANKPKYYAVECDSGRELKRGFCPDCGSHVMFIPGFPDIVIVVAASFDNPSEFKPDTEIWTSSAQPWDLLDSGLRQFEQQFTARISHIFFIVD